MNFLTFNQFCKFLPKSKRKAGDGLINGNYPFYTSSNELSKYINTYDYSGECLIFGTGGKPSIHIQEGCFSTSSDCIVASSFDKTIVYPQYIYQYICSNMWVLEAGFKGAGLKHISKEYISNIKIPIPSIENQVRIAKILTKTKMLIARRKESIKALDELLKSTFLEMFGGIRQSQRNTRTKLGKYILFLTSGSRGWAQYYSSNGAVFFRINNVRNGYLSLDEVTHVNPPENAEALRTKVKTGDLLFSITADLGRTAVVPKEFSNSFVNQHLAIIRLNQSEINPVYAAWFFSMPFGKSIIMKKKREGVKAGLNFDDIKSFDIITPPINKQNHFAEIVKKTEQIKSEYKRSLSKLENLYYSLSQRAFNGNL